jgi:hypothetical protein
MSDFNLDQWIESIQEGKGSLSKNHQKRIDTHPDWRGYLRHNGTVLEISAWIKEYNGKKKFSLAVKPYVKRDPLAPQQPKQNDWSKNRLSDDDMPF